MAGIILAFVTGFKNKTQAAFDSFLTPQTWSHHRNQ